MKGSSYFNNEYIYGPCISKHMLKDDYERILKEYINQGRYIAMDGFDMFYLENSQGYNEYHFSHDAMIYGYDDEKQIFNMLSYNKERFFQPYKCSYESMGKSLNSEHISKEGLAYAMLKTTDEFIELDIKEIKNSISRYLDGKIYKKAEDRWDFYMGVTVYEHAINWLKSDHFFKDIKFLRLIMEHKLFMLERLEKIGVDNEILKRYKYICDTSVIMWNIALKYKLTNKKKLISEIIEKIEYIWHEEVAVLSLVINK